MNIAKNFTPTSEIPQNTASKTGNLLIISHVGKGDNGCCNTFVCIKMALIPINIPTIIMTGIAGDIIAPIASKNFFPPEAFDFFFGSLTFKSVLIFLRSFSSIAEKEPYKFSTPAPIIICSSLAFQFVPFTKSNSFSFSI